MSELVVVSLIGGAGTIIVAFLTSLVTLKVAEKSGRIQKADVKMRRITQLESRVDALESKDRVHQDYIGTLRQHIINGNPPPPPPFPTYPIGI